MRSMMTVIVICLHITSIPPRWTNTYAWERAYTSNV